MRLQRLTVSAAFLALGALALTPGDAAAAGDKLIWKRIVGIAVANSFVGLPAPGADCDPGVDCVVGTPAVWTATDGRAELHLDTGRIEFSVQGLVVASDPSRGNLGTTGSVSMVKGTLVCNDTAPGSPELVDTDAVALDEAGNAKFRGHVELPVSCTAEPDDIVFLIRVADVSDPHFEFLIDMYNAFGAVRTHHDD
jgi:hypothetical protein